MLCPTGYWRTCTTTKALFTSAFAPTPATCTSRSMAIRYRSWTDPPDTRSLTAIRSQVIRERLEELQGLLEIAGPDQKDELLREKDTLAREQRLLGGGQRWAAVQGREGRGSR